jgi:ferredoxin
MRLVVDRNRCIGSGQCVLTEPDVFDQDEEDGRVVILPAVPGDPRATPGVRQAVLFCPSGALTLAIARD